MVLVIPPVGVLHAGRYRSLTGMDADAGRPDTEDMLLERRAQLTALEDYATDAGAGRGRLVLVAGEAGIGKTALVEAFAGTTQLRVAQGACDGLFTPRPLAPLYDAAAGLGGPLLAACREDAPRDQLFSSLLEELRA